MARKADTRDRNTAQLQPTGIVYGHVGLIEIVLSLTSVPPVLSLSTTGAAAKGRTMSITHAGLRALAPRSCFQVKARVGII